MSEKETGASSVSQRCPELRDRRGCYRRQEFPADSSRSDLTHAVMDERTGSEPALHWALGTGRSLPASHGQLAIDRERVNGDPAQGAAVFWSRSVVRTAHRSTSDIRRSVCQRLPSARPTAVSRLENLCAVSEAIVMLIPSSVLSAALRRPLWAGTTAGLDRSHYPVSGCAEAAGCDLGNLVASLCALRGDLCKAISPLPGRCSQLVRHWRRYRRAERYASSPPSRPVRCRAATLAGRSDPIPKGHRS
jgi:hypothetical protein